MNRFLSLLFLIVFSQSTFAQDTSVQTLVKPDVESTGPALVAGDGNSKKVARIAGPEVDARVEKTLKSLVKEAGWFPEIQISVRDGMVIIDGHTKNASQLEWLAKTADRIPSVVAVINKAKIDVEPVTDFTPVLNEMRRLVEKAKRALPLFLLAALMITVFYFIARYVSRGIRALWSRHISNPFLLSTVTKVSMIPIWMLFLHLTMQAAGLSSLATTIIGGTGAIGIVLGFAFKDIAGNYLSGLLLAMRSPFTKGDLIEVDKYEGYVQSLNMRGTTILDLDGNLVLIPNTTIIQSVIKNKTVSPEKRFLLVIGIGYCDSYAKARELIETTLGQIPEILRKPEPSVSLVRLNTSTVDIEIVYWIDGSKSNAGKVKASVLNRTKEVLLANGITMPDASREVVFSDSLKVQVLQGTEDVVRAQNEKAQLARAKATENLAEAKANPEDRSVENQDEQMGKLGEGVDLLHAASSKERAANPSDKTVQP